jgi:hypothetical protein
VSTISIRAGDASRLISCASSTRARLLCAIGWVASLKFRRIIQQRAATRKRNIPCRRFRMSCLKWIAVVLIGLAPLARADDAASVLARFKAASGGGAWDNARSWRGEGTLSAGGLQGEFHVSTDLLSGRSVDAYRLGTLEGGDGYDGKHAWQRDPGGEVAVQDTPDEVRRARSQAWLDAHAYWYPQRMASTLANVETREVDGKHYTVISATPQDGDALTLWFAADSGLLARTQQRQGPDVATTVYDDYREVGQRRVPFHIVTDMTDSAGRTDPRRRVEVQFEHVVWNVPLTDADFAAPAMSATAQIADPSGVTRIAFDLINNHIYVDGSVDGKPARFMLDTGGGNLLTPAAAKKFALSGEGKLAMGGAGEGRVDVALAHAREVRIGAAVLSKPVFYVLDMGQLAQVEGVDADGLVGYEMFRRFCVQIDYANRQVTLSDPAKFSVPANATAIPFTMDERTPMVTGSLDGVPIKLSIDTGSRSSLTLMSPFVREHHLLERYHAAPESVIGWGVGGASRGHPARFGTLTLGNLNIENVAGELYTGNKGAFANPDLGGNLGGGVLRRFTVTFDYTNKQMYLAPNADYGKPDAFDRSGLWLLAAGGMFEVADVVPGSAAAQAGMRVGDRISAFDDEPVARRTLAAWRQRLRELPAGTPVAVYALRGGKELNFSLVLADRIPPKAP